MALSDYNNGTKYIFENAQNITMGDWNNPNIETWSMFAGQLGITTSNYSGYGLKATYWSSSSFVSYYEGGYGVRFDKGMYYQGASNGLHFWVRLARTF
ncbi:MAG: hypothetical protein BHW09_02135 [Clostridium sp. CAG:245_30_32]|nr:MAG: hypothetical protein BHW09_02135 [Clostridium sp. CAG:245_30_32]